MRLKEMIRAMKMKKHNFPTDIICQFEAVAQLHEDNDSKEMKFVKKMDELLTEQQRLLLWEYGGSCTGGNTGRSAKVFALEHVDRSLSERIELLKKAEHMYRHQLNGDGTITVYCFCHCLQHRLNRPGFKKLPTAYGCAAGAALHNFKIALGASTM